MNFKTLDEIRNLEDFKNTDERCGDYVEPWRARALLQQMAFTATRNDEYRERFLNWLANGSTLELIDLISECGLVFQNDTDRHNAFALLDSARMHKDDGPLS